MKWALAVASAAGAAVLVGIVVAFCCFLGPGAQQRAAFRALHCTLNDSCMELTEVPKVIYRTAKTAQLSASHQKAWDFTQQHNPSFRQVLVDDEQADAFMRQALDGTVYDAYRQILPGAAKADLLRYTLLYELGGVYLDIKSGAKEICRLVRPHDRMLVSTSGDRAGWGGWDGVLFGRHSFGELQQWWLLCAPRHPVMLEVVEGVASAIRERVRSGRCAKEHDIAGTTHDVVGTTGPWAFSDAVVRAVQRGSDGVRLTCGDGNGTFVYDVAGDHPSAASYSGSGAFFRCD